jgi:hypothetical protein
VQILSVLNFPKFLIILALQACLSKFRVCEKKQKSCLNADSNGLDGSMSPYFCISKELRGDANAKDLEIELA